MKVTVEIPKGKGVLMPEARANSWKGTVLCYGTVPICGSIVIAVINIPIVRR